MLRRLSWLLVGLGLLALAGYAAVLYFLNTDLPKEKVVAALEDSLGLRVTLDDVRTERGGTTTLRGLTLTPPLDDQPLATFPQVEADHASVLQLVVTGKLNLKRLRLQGGELHLSQDRAGRWNVQDLIDHLAAGEGDAGSSEMPIVEAQSLTLHIHTPDRPALRAEPVSFRGEPVGEVAWDFTGSIPGRIDLKGRVQTTGDFRHELKIVAADIEEFFRPWWDEAPAPVRFSGLWRGAVKDGSLQGGLRVDHAVVGERTGQGSVDIVAGSASVSLAPRDVLITTGIEAIEDLRFAGGSLKLAGESVTVEGLKIQAAGSAALVGGSYNLTERTGDLSLTWSGGIADPDIHHDGSLRLTLSRPVPDRQTLHAELTTTGTTPWGRWDAALNSDAAGPSLAKLRWRVTAPVLAWFDLKEAELPLHGLSTEISLEGWSMKLDRVRLADQAAFEAVGEFDLQRRVWQVSVKADDFRPPGRDIGPLTLNLQASGQGAAARLHDFKARLGDTTLSVTGSYDARRPTPLDAYVQLAHHLKVSPPEVSSTPITPGGAAPPSAGDAEPTPTPPPPSPPAPPAPRFAAHLAWDGWVTGHLVPRDLAATGELSATSLNVRGEPFEDITTPLSFLVNNELITVRSDPFILGGGEARLDGSYTLDDQSTELAVLLDQVQLPYLCRCVNKDLATQGVVNGQIFLHLPGQNIQDLSVSGSWEVSGFESGPLAFDHMEGRLTTRDNLLLLDPLLLRRDAGRAEGVAAFNLTDTRTLTAQLGLSDWPVEVEPAELSLSVTGEADLSADVAARSLRGRIDLVSPVAFQGKHAGNVRASGEWTDAALRLDSVGADLLGGSLDGSAEINLGDYTQSAGRIAWHDLEPAAAQPWWEYGVQVAGRTSGHITFGPATGPRPLEPLRYDVEIETEDLTVRGLDIGHITATGYAGPTRVLLHESSVRFASGLAHLWASATRHGESWFAHADVDFDRLDLNDLNRSFKPDAQPLYGTVTGDIRLLGAIGPRRWPTGKGVVHLTGSDLANSDVFGSLLRVMDFQPEGPDLGGEGTVRFTLLPDAALRIDGFRYFNRGVSAYGDGTIRDLRLGGESPIEFFVIGTRRPFKELKLPFARTLDRLLTNLQSHVTTLRVRGTLDQKTYHTEPLEALSKTLEKLLFPPEEE